MVGYVLMFPIWEWQAYFARGAPGGRQARPAGGQIGRQIGLEFHHFAGHRVLEAEQVGVQGLAAERFQRGAGFGPEAGRLGLEAGAVGLVAHHRVADMRQMHADLVGAAGFQRAFDEARHRLAARDR